MSFIQALVKALQQRGGDADAIFRKLVKPEGESLINQIAELIINGGKVVVRETVKVTVDYSRTLAQMITAGKYDWDDKDITQERFLLTGMGKQEKEITFFHFDRNMESDDVIAAMEKEGFRPADPEDVLAVGEQHSQLQRKYPIIALGKVWRDPGGRRSVVCLRECDSMRWLLLYWYGRSWFARCRFAAVRK